MSLTFALAYNKTQQLFKHKKTVNNNLEMSRKTLQGINPMGLCAPCFNYYLHKWINPPNHNQQILIDLLSKLWDVLTKIRKELTQWFFVTLGPTLIYTTESILQTLTNKPWWPVLLSTTVILSLNNVRLSWNLLYSMMFVNKHLWEVYFFFHCWN